jgi:hypothetical protein
MSTESLLAPRDFPSVFNGFGRWMLPTRFAVWIPAKSDYQIYSVDRDDWPTIRLVPTATERTNPYYFASERADDRSRTFTLYRPRARIHSHIDMAIWHTGGWLCRKQGKHLEPVLPILGVSEPAKLVVDKSVGLHPSPELEEWKEFQTLFFTRPIIHNRIVAIPKKPKEIPEEIPAFVAEALLEKAIASDQTCAISMESFEKEKCAATSCYHLFRREALQEWRKTHTDCPVCKQECSLTLC